MSISQNLKPLLQKIDKQSYLCFNPNQSRFIAKQITKTRYHSMLIDTLMLQKVRWLVLLEKKDTIISKLESHLGNFSKIKENQELELEQLNIKIRSQYRVIQKGKKKQWFLTAGILVLTGVVIIK